MTMAKPVVAYQIDPTIQQQYLPGTILVSLRHLATFSMTSKGLLMWITQNRENSFVNVTIPLPILNTNVQSTR